MFEVGELVLTPTGAKAIVIDIDRKRGEATVYWINRHGDDAKATFRFSRLRKLNP